MARFTSDRDLLIEAVTTLKVQTVKLGEIDKKLDKIDERCTDHEEKIAENKDSIGANRGEIRDLNTRWKIMVGLVAFVIITLVAVAGVVVAYLR